MAYIKLHPVKQLDFQINRILTYGEKACDFDEVSSAAKKIVDVPSWNSIWRQLGEAAEQKGELLHAAYYYRLAEFFLIESPEKEEMFSRSLENYATVIGRDKDVQVEYVPYKNAEMKVMIFKGTNPKGKLVIFGGYDSFIEEFYLMVKELSSYNYDIYLFEGPGQGESLRKGLTFEPEWEKPVRTILDKYELSNVGVVGISWGGYFALRAAAFEPRITKVVAYDILFDGFDCMTNPLPKITKYVVRVLTELHCASIINNLVNNIKSRRLIVDWAITHGQYITGTNTPYDFYQHLKKHTMRGIMDKVACDVLLLAGEHDHYIPLKHYEILMAGLVNTHSLKGRIFTEEEGGAEHCQVGNLQLATKEIMEWLDSI